MYLRALPAEGRNHFRAWAAADHPDWLPCRLPPGHRNANPPTFRALALRSTASMIPNSPVTIDQDFRGSVMVGLYYIGAEPTRSTTGIASPKP